MADTFTPNFNFTLPEVGASINTWPTKLNANFTAIDLALFGLLPKAGGTLTGPIAIAAGSAGTPSLAIAGDPDTGFYSSGAGNVSVACNGVKVAGFDPGGVSVDKLLYTGELNGYVGAVQHSSIRPYQADASNGGIDFYTRGTNTISFRARITPEGRFGLGVTAPEAKIDVEGNWAMKASDLAAGTAIDCRVGSYFYKTITTTTTFTFTNVPASGRFTGFVLELTNGGAFTVNWPASVKWPQGAVPTLTTSGVDILTFVTRDGGTNWRGALVQKGSA